MVVQVGTINIHDFGTNNDKRSICTKEELQSLYQMKVLKKKQCKAFNSSLEEKLILEKQDLVFPMKKHSSKP